MKTRENALQVIECLKDGKRFKQALAESGISWVEFKQSLANDAAVGDAYGGVTVTREQTALLGFASVAELIGRKYRDVLPRIADPTKLMPYDLPEAVPGFFFHGEKTVLLCLFVKI